MTARFALLVLLLLVSSIAGMACEIDCLPHVVHCHMVLIHTDEAGPQLSQAAVRVEFVAAPETLAVPSVQTLSLDLAFVAPPPLLSTPLLLSTVFRI